MPSQRHGGKRPILLLLDFDGTLTLNSTLPLIACISTYPNEYPHPKLAGLSKAYAADLAAHDAGYTPQSKDRRSVQQELAYLESGSLRNVERRSVERVEASGVFEGVRTGDIEVAAAEMFEAGEVEMRRGWARCVEMVQLGSNGSSISTSTSSFSSPSTSVSQQPGLDAARIEASENGRRRGKVAVVSVAWSRRFIFNVMAEAGRAEGGNTVSVPDISVKANEIAEDGSGRLERYFDYEDGDGDCGGGIWTAGDKARVMDRMAKDFTSSSSSSSPCFPTSASTSLCSHTNTSAELEQEDEHEHVGGGVKPRTVYIGDSPTDLACLLNADIGICIRDRPLTSEQRGLRETLERVGVECLFVGEFRKDRSYGSKQAGQADEDNSNGKEARGKHEGRQRRRLWWASDFEDVCDSGILDPDTYRRS